MKNAKTVRGYVMALEKDAEIVRRFEMVVQHLRRRDGIMQGPGRQRDQMEDAIQAIYDRLDLISGVSREMVLLAAMTPSDEPEFARARELAQKWADEMETGYPGEGKK